MRPHGIAHARYVVGERDFHDATAEAFEQRDGGRRRKFRRHDQIGIEREHFFRVAPDAREIPGACGDGRRCGVGGDVAQRADAIRRHEVDQDLVGAQVERNDALGGFGVGAGRQYRCNEGERQHR